MTIKRILAIMLSICLAFSLLPAYARAAGETFFVSSTGSDINDGSQLAPFATIGKAYDSISGDGTIHVLDNLDMEQKVSFDGNKSITLTSENATITYTDSTNIINGNDGLFAITSGALTIENITIQFPVQRGTNGRLLYVGTGADVTLGNGVTLANGYLAYSGGGVLINGGTLTMLDGSTIRDCYVANNTSAYGGGVFIQSGNFIMQGGAITGNTIHTTQGYTSFGGGVAVGAGAAFIFSGGDITGNTVDTAGGGVYLASGGSVSLSGGASVYGNTAVKPTAITSNIYLPTDDINISVNGALTGSVGITSGEPDYYVVVGTPNGYAISATDESGMFYDTGVYDIRLDDTGNLILYYFTVAVDLTGGSVTSTNTATETPINMDYDTVLVPDVGFELPDEIDITVGGVFLGEHEYTYNPITGAVHIPGAVVTGDIVIDASGNKQYTIALTVANARISTAASITVIRKSTTIINITAATHYAIPDSVVVAGSCDYSYASGVLTFTNVTSNISVTVIGEEIPHTIHYDPNGGQCAEAQTSINESQTLIGTLPTPTRAGYTFTGWFTASGTRVTAATTNYMTEDLYLTARWSADTNITYTVNHFIEYVDSGINPGYITGDTLHQISYGGTTRSYYLYTSNTYNDGIADGSRTINYLLLDDLGALPISGIIASGANEYSVTMLPDGSSVFPFYYDRNGFTVSFEPNNGTMNVGDQSMAVTFGSLYGQLPNADRTGYTLIGWFTTPTGGVQISASDPYLLAENQTLYAHWQANGDVPYTVIHMTQKLNDNIVGYEKTPYNYGVHATDILYGTADMTVDAYSVAILGFEVSAENSYSTTVLPDGSTVHFLYYDRIITDVSYNPNGGSSMVVKSRLYYGGTFASFPSSPTRSGYTFKGWYLGMGEESQQVTLGMALNDINPLAAKSLTLYAHWTQNPPSPPPSGGNPPAKTADGEHHAYIQGRDDGLIHPEAQITRAETAMIFYRLLSESTQAKYSTTSNEFADVEIGAWYNTVISTLANMGILNGYDDGNFYPNNPITRAEYAAIAARFGISGEAGHSQFSDISGHWAEVEIQAAAHKGWIVGYPDGTFRPDTHITRAEAIAMTNRVLNRSMIDHTSLLSGMKKWPDNADKTAWYYLDVQEATNSHSYYIENGVESWFEILK